MAGAPEQMETFMHRFVVNDMTCGHCAGRITKALKAADSTAKVEVSLAEHLVKVESELSPEELAQHIAEAGYTPQRVAP
jgi:copper chaperone